MNILRVEILIESEYLRGEPGFIFAVMSWNGLFARNTDANFRFLNGRCICNQAFQNGRCHTLILCGTISYNVTQFFFKFWESAIFCISARENFYDYETLDFRSGCQFFAILESRVYLKYHFPPFLLF